MQNHARAQNAPKSQECTEHRQVGCLVNPSYRALLCTNMHTGRRHSGGSHTLQKSARSSDATNYVQLGCSVARCARRWCMRRHANALETARASLFQTFYPNRVPAVSEAFDLRAALDELNGLPARIQAVRRDLLRPAEEYGPPCPLDCLVDLVARWLKLTNLFRAMRFFSRMHRAVTDSIDLESQRALCRVRGREIDIETDSWHRRHEQGRAPPDLRRSLAVATSPITLNGPPTSAVPRILEEAHAA
jgi:hypothetical protein